MVPEATLDDTETGKIPTTDGWFVVNARDVQWYHREGRPAVWNIEGTTDFPRLGANLNVLWPGQPMAMYHWEADQEDFLVLAGEALLIIEGEERALRQWDFVHCPPWTPHVFVGAGTGRATVLALGGRSGGGTLYPVSELALRHGAGVREATTSPRSRTAAPRSRSGCWSIRRSIRPAPAPDRRIWSKRGSRCTRPAAAASSPITGRASAWPM